MIPKDEFNIDRLIAPPPEDLRSKHWAADMAIINRRGRDFVARAESGFDAHGRGLVVYVVETGQVEYMAVDHLDANGDYSDEIKMSKKYDPDKEVILSIVHADDTVGLYTFNKIAGE